MGTQASSEIGESGAAPPRNRSGRKGTRKTGGRKKGSRNRVTIEAREFAQGVLSDESYRKKLTAKARKGQLSPPVECMLWHYAYGKPVERHDLTAKLTLADLIAASREVEP